MSTPDEIRSDIERTRAQMSDDVDLLADTANPKNVAKRQVSKVGDKVGGVKDKVMGSAHSAQHAVSDKTSGAAGSVGDVPGKLQSQAQGSPLAAGLIAFGAGLLVSALIPTSDAERSAAATAKEKAAPLADQAKQVAQEAGQHLKEPAQEAAQQLKSSATDAAQTVKGEGQQAAVDVRSDAQDAKQTVQQNTSNS